MESNLRHLIAKMTKEKCILCGKETVSVIKTGTDFMCYNCYADQRNPTRSKDCLLYTSPSPRDCS